jgi:ribosomal protein L21E
VMELTCSQWNNIVRKGMPHKFHHGCDYHVPDIHKVNGVVHKGMPHKFYHGRVDQVVNISVFQDLSYR